MGKTVGVNYLNRTKLKNKIGEENNEFYTTYESIEKEMQYYLHLFKDKIIYLPCDDPKLMVGGKPVGSQFWNYFYNNFDKIGLKQLIATYYDKNNTAKIYSYENGKLEVEDLGFNGDFLDDRLSAVIEHSDVVITNPPYSPFRAYVKKLLDMNKDFILVGPVTAVSYKIVMGQIALDKIKIGNSRNDKFTSPNGEKLATGSFWYTTLNFKRIINYRQYKCKYDPKYYPKYDNYDAINIDKSSEIPNDYYGFMGVPQSFIHRYDFNKFKICKCIKPKLNGKDLYNRLIIKRIVED